MTEFSVGDRVLVPGVVTGFSYPEHEYDVTYASGKQEWHYATDLRPDTGGRDLTAQDVRKVLATVGTFPCSGLDQVAEYLNRIARGDAGSAGDDTAPPYCALCGCDHQHEHDDADVIDGSRGCIQCRWCSGEFPNAGPWAEANAPDDEDRAIQPIDWARREVLFLAREVCEYRGSEIGGKKLDQLAVAFTTLDEKVAEKRAAAAARRVELAAAGPRAADTAPDDDLAEIRKTLQDAIDERDAANAGRIKATGEELWEMQGAAALAESVLSDLPDVAELDRLRSDAAALRDAGNALADRLERVALFGPVPAEVTAWRSAAGGEQ